MVGIVVAGHGHLARELIATAELIIGALQNAIACDIAPNASPQELEDELRAAVKQVDTGDGVLVLADLLGGTPCTRSVAVCRKQRAVEVLTGVNLPMLLKANALRQTRPLRELAPAVVESVKGSIAWATQGQGQDTSL